MNEKQGTPQKAKILIIEDSAAIQKLTKQVLTFQKEYDIFFANNGKEALEIIKKSDPFHVILIDIEMPVMNGKECIRQIRALSDREKATVPVIVCTGNAEEHSAEEFKEMGFDDSFIKPIDYQGLMVKIKPMLEKDNN